MAFVFPQTILSRPARRVKGGCRSLTANGGIYYNIQRIDKYSERREFAVIPACDPGQSAVKDQLQDALLRGDRSTVAALLENGAPDALVRAKNSFLNDLTDRYLAGSLPFCQLTAAAQAASAFPAPDLPPVACCGAAQGNTSAAGRDYTLMLLSMWGVPVLDLGVDVAPETFLSAVLEHHLRFIVCVLFTPADAECVRRIHALAEEHGCRKDFSLLVCGASPSEDKSLLQLPADFVTHRAAAAAQWVMNAWKR